jgi:hypothetical protein
MGTQVSLGTRLRHLRRPQTRLSARHASSSSSPTGSNVGNATTWVIGRKTAVQVSNRCGPIVPEKT